MMLVESSLESMEVVGCGSSRVSSSSSLSSLVLVAAQMMQLVGCM